MGKKAVLLLASLLLVLGMTLPAAAGPFQDVPADHWAYDAVAKLVAAGLVEGFPDGTFKGDRSMNRYQFAQIIARMVDKLDRLVKDQVQVESAAAMKAAKEAQDLASQAMEAAKSAKDPEAMNAATAAMERAEAAYQAALAAQAKADAAFDEAGGARSTAESAQAAADSAAQIAQEAKALAEKAAGVKPTEVVRVIEKSAPAVDLTPLEQAIAKLNADKVSNQQFLQVMSDADLAVATVEQLLDRMDAAEKDLAARREAEAALLAKVADIEKTVKDLLVEFKDDLAAQNVKLSQVQDLIDQLGGRVAALEDDVAGLKAANAALGERTTALEGKTGALDERVGKSEGKIKTLEDDVALLKVRTSVLEDTTASIGEKLDAFIAEHEKVAFTGSTSVVFTDAKRLGGNGTMYADPVNDFGNVYNVIADQSTFQQKLSLGMAATPAAGVVVKGSLSLVNDVFGRGVDSTNPSQPVGDALNLAINDLSLDVTTDGALKSAHFGKIDAAAAADGFPKAIFSADGFGYDPAPVAADATKDNAREGGMFVLGTGPITTKMILSRFVLDAHDDLAGTITPISAEYAVATRSALALGDAATVGVSFTGDRIRNYAAATDDTSNRAFGVDLAGKMGNFTYGGDYAYDAKNEDSAIDASGSAKLGPATLGVNYLRYGEKYGTRFQEPWAADVGFHPSDADSTADWNKNTTKTVATVSVPVWLVTLSGEYGMKNPVTDPAAGTNWQKGQAEMAFLGGTVKSYVKNTNFKGGAAPDDRNLQVYAGLEKAKLFKLLTFTTYLDRTMKSDNTPKALTVWADASMPFKLIGLPLELAAEYGMQPYSTDAKNHVKGSVGIKDWKLGERISANAGLIRDQHSVNSLGSYTPDKNVWKIGGDVSVLLFKELKATGSYWMANNSNDAGAATSAAQTFGLDLTYPVAGADLTAGAKLVRYDDKVADANDYSTLKLNAGLSYSF